MTHQTVSLEKYWKLFPATLNEANKLNKQTTWKSPKIKYAEIHLYSARTKWNKNQFT